ncbi:hypothetical protein JWJ88_17610 [Paracoccus methylovorus]|uniref:Uncharacterized protein n=1 Tax=Paracoccus methylovorus TaxID=2812658 RepID=A0ABX7JMQ4_9RHOB|nr:MULTISPECIES: hypothetical protein [Paracoccus]QRZ14776.1 hypothetical protein JWJ88_17610 [Paracoccus methylovorus]
MPDDLGGRRHPWHVGMKTGGDLISAMFVGNHDQARAILQNRETLDSFTFQMAQPTGDLSTLKQVFDATLNAELSSPPSLTSRKL